jgi:hypothetical protein
MSRTRLLLILLVLVPVPAFAAALTLRLNVDAMEGTRNVLHARLRIPVGPGELTLAQAQFGRPSRQQDWPRPLRPIS